MTSAALRLALAASLVTTALAACSSSSSSGGSSPADDAGSGVDASPTEDAAPAVDAADASSDAPAITGKCADSFGSALTEGFGRLDGVVFAVQKPSDTQCVMPNSDHVVIQVLWNGAVYRMVVNVEDTSSQPMPLLTGTLDHALPAPAYAEGWHAIAPLDYLSTLGVHASDPMFAPHPMNEVVDAIAKAVHPGDPIAVYATVGAGRPESAHLVHRNKTNEDGAIVLSPAGSPKFMLFHFADQTF